MCGWYLRVEEAHKKNHPGARVSAWIPRRCTRIKARLVGATNLGAQWRSCGCAKIGGQRTYVYTHRPFWSSISDCTWAAASSSTKSTSFTAIFIPVERSIAWRRTKRKPRENGAGINGSPRANGKREEGGPPNLELWTCAQAATDRTAGASLPRAEPTPRRRALGSQASNEAHVLGQPAAQYLPSRRGQTRRGRAPSSNRWRCRDRT